METYQAIYLIDFYVGGHHIFKVGMSANPHSRVDNITTSLYEKNVSNIQAPLDRFIHEVIFWEFKSVWIHKSKGAEMEQLLLNELKRYSQSLKENSEYGGRKWNSFEGMFEAYPIRSKYVYSMKNSLERIMDIETKDNPFFVRKTHFHAYLSYHINLITKK